jgi:hypothetical protein
VAHLRLLPVSRSFAPAMLIRGPIVASTGNPRDARPILYVER